jgi:peptidoglycan/xylan/chitin deacetylase (PgdA/CDA1 family)
MSRLDELQRRRARRRRLWIRLLIVALGIAVVAVVHGPWIDPLGLWGQRDGASETSASASLLAGTPSAGAGSASDPSESGADGGQAVSDGRGPAIKDVSVRPSRLTSAATVKLTFAVAPADGTTVEWSVVDTFGRTVGKSGAVHDAKGRERISWRAKEDGKPLFPGTYRLRVVARDAGGDVSVASATLASAAPVQAQVIKRLPKAGNKVALTFDGGSGYAWRHIMKALAKRDATGTFFCTGVSITRYPQVAREAVALGMTLGNHSYDHPVFTRITDAEARRQLEANAAAWWKACKVAPMPFFRPPYGAYDADTVRVSGAAGYPFVVSWDVDTNDWTKIPPAQVARNAVSAARPGSIILMHTQWNTQKAIPAILKGLREKGLKPVGMDELVRAAGLL